MIVSSAMKAGSIPFQYKSLFMLIKPMAIILSINTTLYNRLKLMESRLTRRSMDMENGAFNGRL